MVAGSLAASQVNSLPSTSTPPSITPPPAVAAKAPVITTEEISESKPIAYQSSRIKDPSLLVGNTSIKQVGVNGVTTLTYKVTKTDGKQTAKELVREVITTHPVNEIIADGTKVVPKCDDNYSGGCVPLVSYDLDCADIGFRVYIVGYDKHGFDGNDNDGIGCESY